MKKGQRFQYAAAIENTPPRVSQQNVILYCWWYASNNFMSVNNQCIYQYIVENVTYLVIVWFVSPLHQDYLITAQCNKLKPLGHMSRMLSPFDSIPSDQQGIFCLCKSSVSH